MKYSSSVIFRILVCILGLAAAAAPAAASSINCAGANRAFSLGDATSCTQGISANPDSALINSQGGVWLGSWQQEGELTAAGTNDLFSVTLTNGTFGAGDASGTWSIDPSFWTSWGRAVISVHVGDGGGDPDWWLFLVEPGDLSGTWVYDITSGTGGGLSNLKLWGTGTPNQQLVSAPEPASMMLLGTGLTGLAFAIRRRRRNAA